MESTQLVRNQSGGHLASTPCSLCVVHMFLCVVHVWCVYTYGECCVVYVVRICGMACAYVWYVECEVCGVRIGGVCGMCICCVYVCV